MKDDDITKQTNSDWAAFDALTDAQVHEAAKNDPDARPLTEADMGSMKRTPQAKIVRRALGLTQEAFAQRYHIPVGTLRDWEQGRCEPDQTAQAFLLVIAREPEMTLRALQR